MSSSANKPTFTLYRGWHAPNQLVWSPFVTKVELRFRLAGVPYTSEAGSTTQSPKGKIPYITAHYSNGNDDTFSDSTLIIRRLVHEGHLPDLNAPLSSETQLADLALRALLEDKLYFYHTHERWVSNYHTHRDHILSHLSGLKRAAVGLLIYRSITATLHGQGTGRYSAEEIEANRYEIWQTIERRLADSWEAADDVGISGEPFWVLGRAEPTEADVTLFGFISSVLIAKSGPRSQEVVRGFPAIMEYANRIFKKYFDGFEHWG